MGRKPQEARISSGHPPSPLPLAGACSSPALRLNPHVLKRVDGDKDNQHGDIAVKDHTCATV